MTSIERNFRVNFRHRVFFTDHVFEPGNSVLHELMQPEPGCGPSRALVVLDESLVRSRPGLMDSVREYFAAHPENLQLATLPLVLEGGERVKNSYFHVSEIQSHIERHGLCRHSYLIGVGGGALLDVVGLASATAHRGLRHIRIPTTTLSQADSGVGVKNGINAFGKKNFIGSFAPPHAVVNDFQWLDSLPNRDRRGGYSEAVKVALIRDLKFFEWLEAHAVNLKTFDSQAMRYLIQRSAELHVDHITGCGDPFELGSARPLDFGHWAAHKLEQVSEYQIRHGEAVAIGIALDVIYSNHMGFLEASQAERVLTLLEILGFRLFSNELTHEDSHNGLLILKGLDEFREHLGGRLTITLLKEIGQGFEVNQVDLPWMTRSLQELKQRHLNRSLNSIPSTRV